MLKQLAIDLRVAPNAFQLFAAAPREVVERALTTLPSAVHPPLRTIWGLTAGGDAFETEEIYGPGLAAHDFERMWDFELINRSHRDTGLPATHYVFHDGIELTAVDHDGNVVTLDRASYGPVHRWRDLDEWYLGLRGVYESTYRLPVL